MVYDCCIKLLPIIAILPHVFKKHHLNKILKHNVGGMRVDMGFPVIVGMFASMFVCWLIGLFVDDSVVSSFYVKAKSYNCKSAKMHDT